MKVRYVVLSVIGFFPLCLSVHANVLSDGAPNPNDADLLMWLKADSLALTNGANVSTWSDSSNKGRHMLGGISGVGSPTFQTNVLSGLPCVRFDGTLKIISNGNGTSAFVLSQEHTIIAVAHSKRVAADITTSDAFLSYTDYTNGGKFQDSDTEFLVYQAGAADSSKAWRMRYPGIDTFTSTVNTALASPAIYAQARACNVSLRGYLNQTIPEWLDITTASGDFSTTNRIFRIGEHANSNQYLKGDVFEILVYNRLLSSEELRELYDYLNAKWFGNPTPQPQIVLEAQFNGGSSGTGGSSDIVRVGGTAASFNDSNMNNPTFVSTTPLVNVLTGSTGYMHLEDPNGTAGSGGTGSGVVFTPVSTRNSPESWYKNRGATNFDLVNGALDFLYRCNTASGSWGDSTCNPIDIDGGANGMRLIIKSTAANTLRAQLQAKNGSNTVVQDIIASGAVSFAANTTYHIAVTVTTDGSGVVALKLFSAPGNSPIDTATATPINTTATSTGAFDGAGTNAVTHAFNSGSSFKFGQRFNPAGQVATDFDTFRIYAGVPDRFEPFQLYPIDATAFTKPDPEPSLPAGFDKFSPPTTGSAPTGTFPTFAEWTRTGTAGDVLVATGDKLSKSTYAGADEGKDIRFTAYGESPLGNAITTASIYRQEGTKIGFGLSPVLPKWTMYFLWPRSDDGVGQPVAINRTDAWWVGPSTAVVGQTVSVFGRNLSHDNGTSTAWVYIKPLGQVAGQFVTPTAVNPYKVDFVMPALSNGTYELWAHNGHGRSYGWSGPLTLAVDSKFNWTGGTVNVPSNSTAAQIQTLINGAAASATLNFPAGTFNLNNELMIARNDLRLKGAGKTLTHLVATGSSFVSRLIFIGPATNIEIADLHLDGGTATRNPVTNTITLLNAGSTSAVKITNVSITGTQAQGVGVVVAEDVPIDIAGCSRLLFSGCDITGYHVSFRDCSQIFFDQCNFNAMFDSNIIYTFGPVEMAVTRCTAKDFDNSTDTGPGWATGRFWFNAPGARTVRSLYMGHNRTADLAVRPGYSNQNAGEQFCCDGAIVKFVAQPTSVPTSSTAVFSSLGTLAAGDAGGAHAIIYNGKGIGQVRLITGVNTGTKTITVSPVWNVTPDTSSKFTVGYFYDRIGIYRNLLDGKLSHVTDAAATDQASTGISVHVGCTTLAADLNTIAECRTGILSRAAGGDPNLIEPNEFNLFANNYVQTFWRGLDLGAGTTDEVLFAQVFRGNLVSNSIGTNPPGSTTAFQGNIDAGTRPLDYNVLDRNYLPNHKANLSFGGVATTTGNTLYVNNDLRRGSGTFSGSIGFNFGFADKFCMIGNNVQNYETPYAATSPSPAGSVEVPTRIITMIGKAGSSSQTTKFTVHNGGNASLTWGITTSSTGSWLSASAPTPNPVSIGASSTVTLTCNPASLAANANGYIGTVNAQIGGVTKRVAQVVFVVIP